MTATATVGQSAEDIIRRIIADITLKPTTSFGLDDDLPRLLSLDSLSLLRIVADIEATFNVRVDDARFHELRTLRAMLGEVNRR
ncbi:MAG TPA: phosphopantetheine-binding protein [Gemmatimonadaceae bacterium]|nr:phosphopantetheine-binding protein [Gemmatimonadaceae bacterium]